MLRNKFLSRVRTQPVLFLFRSSLQNMAGEELAHHVVGNDSGMYKAGFAGDDAPRAVPSDARHATTNSALRLKSIPFCPRAHAPSAPFEKSK